jgi:hypothetical protein
MKRLLKISGIIIGSIVLVSILSSITQKDWLTVLSALLMPTVAGITTYIAVQQYKLERVKTRHFLYEKRFKIYKATMEFLGSIIGAGNITDEELLKFKMEIAESIFLFKEEISKYLDELFKKGIDLNTVNKLIQSRPSGEELNKLIDRQSEIFEWFQNQILISRDKFKKYLSVEL